FNAAPTYFNISPEHHLKLTFNDINEEAAGMKAASVDDVDRLLRFITAWDKKAPLLIHCWAGISRSTASAFAALCLLHPDKSEIELAQILRLASPSATPNRLITKHVDDRLGRKGRMLRAVDNIGRGANAYEGVPFILSV
ncbi:MAG: protein tyrosine phosphatase, partial [Aestuariivirga sp.]